MKKYIESYNKLIFISFIFFISTLFIYPVNGVGIYKEIKYNSLENKLVENNLIEAAIVFDKEVGDFVVSAKNSSKKVEVSYREICKSKSCKLKTREYILKNENSKLELRLEYKKLIDSSELKVVSLKYNGYKIIKPKNNKFIVQNNEFKLKQNLTIDNKIKVYIDYNNESDKSYIITDKNGIEKKYYEDGLTLIKLVTNSGYLDFDLLNTHTDYFYYNLSKSEWDFTNEPDDPLLNPESFNTLIMKDNGFIVNQVFAKPSPCSLTNYSISIKNKIISIKPEIIQQPNIICPTIISYEQVKIDMTMSKGEYTLNIYSFYDSEPFISRIITL